MIINISNTVTFFLFAFPLRIVHRFIFSTGLLAHETIQFRLSNMFAQAIMAVIICQSNFAILIRIYFTQV